jgi:hypothetical protein
LTEALSSIRPPEEHAAEAAPISVQRMAQPPASGSVRNRSAKKSRCSFCRAELDESLELTIPGSGKHGQSTGCFCSMQCRNCVLALAALHPSPLASDDFVSRRALLTDRLLDLWRQGQGPDPGLVLQAATRASCGLSTAVPAVLTGAHAGAQGLSTRAIPWLLSEPD